VVASKRDHGKVERLTGKSIDHIFGESLKTLSSSDSYTVLYLSSPAEIVYEAEFQDPMYDELKKRAADYLVAGPLAWNKTEWNKLPLFEKYVFFHPGRFQLSWNTHFLDIRGTRTNVYGIAKQVCLWPFQLPSSSSRSYTLASAAYRA
jgi:hypothetical protein